MSDLISTFSIAASGMRAQATRLQHVSENIANTDTPGYRRKSVEFRQQTDFSTDIATVQAGPVQLDKSAFSRVFDPAHPMADPSGHYDGSNVNLMVESADAREAQRSYEANLRMFDQTRQMASGLLDLLRR